MLLMWLYVWCGWMSGFYTGFRSAGFGSRLHNMGLGLGFGREVWLLPFFGKDPEWSEAKSFRRDILDMGTSSMRMPCCDFERTDD
jgi:hypothetical protein